MKTKLFIFAMCYILIPCALIAETSEKNAVNSYSEINDDNSDSSQSIIVFVDGISAMGDDKSRKQTEREAMANAKRNASEQAITYIRSEMVGQNFEVVSDILEAYSNAFVQILDVTEKKWFKDEMLGEAYKVSIRAEVAPDIKSIKNALNRKVEEENIFSSLSLKIWTDKDTYLDGEKLKVYIKSNKPCYARVIYLDSANNIVQILPNPYRNDHYFQGGVVYEIPSGPDKFDLVISSPFGEEKIIAYASTSPLGDITLSEFGGFYSVSEEIESVSLKSRSIKVIPRQDTLNNYQSSEFIESKIKINTLKRSD